MSARLLFNKEIATVLHLINWQSHFKPHRQDVLVCNIRFNYARRFLVSRVVSSEP